ncbi:S8 family serine peptidase, partial [Pseudomonas aeruginosa]
VAVAVLDTGVMAAHRDLRDAVKGRKSFVGGDGLDAHGHGTHCAGAIGARRNDWGTVGVAPECDLYCGQVLDASGRGDYGSVK